MEINIINSDKISRDKKERKKFEKLFRKTAEIISEAEDRNFNYVSVYLCDDKDIRKLNKKYLGHDYETDIITFHYNEDNEPIEGELVVSLETVLSNSKRFKTQSGDEILRVLIHGLLHLCGYNDTTAGEKKKIRTKENKYIKILRHAGKNN